MSDDQECTHIWKMGVKEWAHSFFFLVSEIWAKLKKLVSVEHVGKSSFEGILSTPPPCQHEMTSFMDGP